jgi:hypothetical protein
MSADGSHNKVGLVVRTPSPPEPLPALADEATIILPIRKQKRINHSFQNNNIEKGITQKYLSPKMISVHPQKGKFPGNISGAASEE